MTIFLIILLVVSVLVLLIAWAVDGRFKVGLSLGGIVLGLGLLVNWGLSALGVL